MAEQIKLHSFRKEVDSTYVGFTPNGGSIKPVHVANGVQRCIFGGFNTAMQIKRLALVSDAKGNVPTGSELETIYAELAKNEAIEDTQLPNEVDVLLDMEQESLAGLNVLAQATDELSSDDMKKLGAVVTLAKPQNAEQIKNLVENLDLFDFAPGAHTPEEYGKYMIQQSGHFDYDENLDEFYDYEKYGLQRMGEEDGMFTDRGYIAYKGYTSLAEIMDGSQSSHMEMGGMA